MSATELTDEKRFEKAINCMQEMVNSNLDRYNEIAQQLGQQVAHDPHGDHSTLIMSVNEANARFEASREIFETALGFKVGMYVSGS